MRNGLVIVACAMLLGFGVVAVYHPTWATGFFIAAVLSAVTIAIFRRFTTEKHFLTELFLAALAIRMAFGIFLQLYPDARGYFGGDSALYDWNGSLIADYWLGDLPADNWSLQRATTTALPGWGMSYLTGFIYLIFGRNIFAAQSFCAVFGAATAPMVYFCSQKIFSNKSVSKFAAIAIAFFPAFVIWSSQLLKDGLIVFLLVLAMTMVLTLQEKFSYPAIFLLVFSLFGILSLRFYIFYMVAVAVAGSFIVGMSNTNTSILRRTAVLLLVGILLTYLGVTRNANVDIEQYANLERIQRSRVDLARSAESGFGEDIDVSTTEGAIAAIPIGLAYLMLAPFPWQIGSLRQAITIPEVLLWWSMIPLLIAGIWWTIRNRLRSAFPILFFSLMLTLAYSIFQGNVGTAYRQRTQIQVFLFIFIGVGWTLLKERREDRKLLRGSKQRKFDERIRAGAHS